MMLYDCYYYYCHFFSKYHCFLQCKIKSYKESGIKIITINRNIALSCIYEWMKWCKTRKNINELFILLRNIILLMKSQLVTNYTLKHDVNRCEWVSECCSKQIQQIFSYIMARTSYFSMRWWWRSLCSIPTRWVGFLYC